MRHVILLRKISIGEMCIRDRHFPIRFMCLPVEVIPFFQNTATFIKTSVADIRRLEQTKANFFLVHRANLVTTVAKNAAPGAVRLVAAKLDAMAIPDVYKRQDVACLRDFK